MKLAQSLALIITGSASFVIPFALASFRVAMVTDDRVDGPGKDLVACPLGHYTCDCFQKRIGAANVLFNGSLELGTLSLRISKSFPGFVVGCNWMFTRKKKWNLESL